VEVHEALSLRRGRNASARARASAAVTASFSIRSFNPALNTTSAISYETFVGYISVSPGEEKTKTKPDFGEKKELTPLAMSSHIDS
jgi:hypothetical protein